MMVFQLILADKSSSKIFWIQKKMAYRVIFYVLYKLYIEYYMR